MPHRTEAPQIPLFLEVQPSATLPSGREGTAVLLDPPGRGRHDESRVTSDYEPVDEEEAACFGRALLARMRGEALSPEQRALLARARASRDPSERRAPTPVVDISETLLALERGDRAELRVSLRRYKGSSPFLDIRRWERAGHEMRPTRQGVTVRAREVTRFVGAVMTAASRLARAAGG